MHRRYLRLVLVSHGMFLHDRTRTIYRGHGQLAQENHKWCEFYHVDTLCGKPTLLANNAGALRKAILEARGG